MAYMNVFYKIRLKETESTRTKQTSILKTLKMLRNYHIYTKGYIRNRHSLHCFTIYYNQLLVISERFE